MEPVYIAEVLGVADHPVAQASLRGRAEVADRLIAAFERGPWLMGERFTATDILVCSPDLYLPDATPDHPAVREWLDRCKTRSADGASEDAD